MSNTTATITRKGSFDAGHRVMNQTSACRNMHGHTYHYELSFEYDALRAIGYPIDFKEIKRVGCQWIEDHLDHGWIANPQDSKIIRVANDLESKTWQMSLNGITGYCNPTAENIAKEILLAMQCLFPQHADGTGLKIGNVRLYETPNCFVDCSAGSIPANEQENFIKRRSQTIERYRNEKGQVDYDDRNTASC